MDDVALEYCWGKPSVIHRPEIRTQAYSVGSSSGLKALRMTGIAVWLKQLGPLLMSGTYGFSKVQLAHEWALNLPPHESDSRSFFKAWVAGYLRTLGSWCWNKQKRAEDYQSDSHYIKRTLSPSHKKPWINDMAITKLRVSLWCLLSEQ